jgi:hypothetical protein
MKKLAAVGIILSTLSGSVWAHEAGEFLFVRVLPPFDRRKGLITCWAVWVVLTSVTTRNWG